MNCILKIGLIGLTATILLAVIFKIIGIASSYIAPFALPWAVIIIIGATYRKRKE